MAILATVLETLLTKAGVDPTNENFLKLIQTKELATIEVPDEISTPMTSLLSMNEAKKNSELKNHYFATALDPLDGKVKEWAKEFGIEEADLTEILSDKSTFNRVEKSIRKIAELKSKAVGGDKGDKEKYTAEIQKLSQQLSEAANTNKAEIETLKSTYENQLMNKDIDFAIGSQPLPGQFAADVERKMARMFIDQELEKNKASLIMEDGKIKIVQKDNKTFPIFDPKGKELDFQTLTTAALAGNKFLKVKGNEPPAPPQRGGTPATPTHVNQEMLDSINATLGTNT